MPEARAEIVGCETCGGAADKDAEGRTRGERLLCLLRAALLARGEARVDVSSVRCLWACTRSCAVHIRSQSRPGYVIAGLEPNEEHARALLDYTAMYAQSEAGAVPYKTWPPALKGHFLCRIPPSAAPHDAAPAPADSSVPNPEPST